MSNSGESSLQLDFAGEEHIPDLLALQQAFHNYKPREGETMKIAYEITNDPFSEEDFKNIISRSECVILSDGDIPVGFMLIDTCSGTQGLNDYKEAINSLIEEDYLDRGHKGVSRFAEVLNPGLYEKQFQEVRWQMLAHLIYASKDRYDGLIYGFFTNADTLIEKLNLGWKLAYDNGLYYYLVWDFSQIDTNND